MCGAKPPLPARLVVDLSLEKVHGLAGERLQKT